MARRGQPSITSTKVLDVTPDSGPRTRRRILGFSAVMSMPSSAVAWTAVALICQRVRAGGADINLSAARWVSSRRPLGICPRWTQTNSTDGLSAMRVSGSDAESSGPTGACGGK